MKESLSNKNDCKNKGKNCPPPSQIQSLKFGSLSPGGMGQLDTLGNQIGDVISLGGYQNGIFEIYGKKKSTVKVSIISDGDLNHTSDKVDVSFSILGSDTVTLHPGLGTATIEVVGLLTVGPNQKTGEYYDTYQIIVE